MESLRDVPRYGPGLRKSREMREASSIKGIVRTKINRYVRGLGWLNSYDQNWNAVARPSPCSLTVSRDCEALLFFVRPLEKVSLSLHVEQECVKNSESPWERGNSDKQVWFRSFLRVGNSTLPDWHFERFWRIGCNAK